MKRTLMASVFACALTGFASGAVAEQKEAILGGGCFWCIEKDFEKVAGVHDVISGYTGGRNVDPTYQNHTAFGHREVVKIIFDDDVISYEKLLKSFWRSVDPTDAGGQFCDRGHSYTTAIYALDEKQLETANTQKANLDASGLLSKPIVTEIALAQKFTPAEEGHQDYYKKNPVRYSFYRYSCGRDQRVKEVWGDQAYRGIHHAGS